MTIFSFTVNIRNIFHRHYDSMNFKNTGLHLIPLSVIFTISAIPSVVHAEGWNIQPSIEARTGWSDNIEFEDDGEESGFVSQINPGISIEKPTGRLQVLLDYQLQNFYYHDGGDLDTEQDLESIARYALIPDTFFINGFATATQVIVDNDQQISVDNFNDTGNTTDEYSFGFGPQWVQNIAGYAKADIGYLYSEQIFDEESDEDGVEGDIDNNDRQTFSASLSNIDQRSDRLDWVASYIDDKIDFEDSETFDFTTYQLDLGYELTSRLELVGSYGYEDNDLGENAAFNDDDGDFWTLGALASFGEYSSLEVRRAERFFGDFWLGTLLVGGPRLAVTATYEERADLSGIGDVDFNFDIGDNNLDLLDTEVEASPDDRDSVSVAKSWDVAISYVVSKSTFVAEYSNSDQEFLDTTNTEMFENYALAWLWQISGQTSLLTRIEYQEDVSDDLGVETKTEFYDLDVEFRRALSPKTDFDVSYSYTDGKTDDLANEDFTANTISVGIIHRF